MPVEYTENFPVASWGLRILDKIDAARGDVFRHRPAPDRGDCVRVLGRAAFWRSARAGTMTR